MMGAVALSAIALALTAPAQADVYNTGTGVLVTTGLAPFTPDAPVAGIAVNGTPFSETWVYGSGSGAGFVPATLGSPSQNGTPLPSSGVAVNALPVVRVSPPGYAAPYANSSWISIDTQPDGTPIKLSPANGSVNLTFKYTTNFTLGVGGLYNISGGILHDDDYLAGFVDGFAITDPQPNSEYPNYGTPHNINPLSANLGAGAHTLTFYIADNHFDRTALDFALNFDVREAPPVPEPGTVAFGVVLTTGLMGLMGRARLRARKG